MHKGCVSFTPTLSFCLAPAQHRHRTKHQAFASLLACLLGTAPAPHPEMPTARPPDLYFIPTEMPYLLGTRTLSLLGLFALHPCLAPYTKPNLCLFVYHRTAPTQDLTPST